MTTVEARIAIQQKEVDKATEKMREAMREHNTRKYNNWAKRLVNAKCLIEQIKRNN